MSSVASSLLGFITMAQPRKCKERLKTLAVGHEWVTNQHLIVYLKERWMTMQTMHWWLVILRTTCNQRQSLESIMWSSFIELRSHKTLSKSSRGNNDHVWSFWLRHVGPWKGLCANEWNQKRQSCSVKNTCKNCCFFGSSFYLITLEKRGKFSLARFQCFSPSFQVKRNKRTMRNLIKKLLYSGESSNLLRDSYVAKSWTFNATNLLGI